jgi:hypothetical protein
VKAKRPRSGIRKTAPARAPLAIDGRGRHGIIDRSEYMIDGFRVSYDAAGRCRCGCDEFLAHATCKHAREVAGRLAAQGRIAEHVGLGASKAYSTRLKR